MKVYVALAFVYLIISQYPHVMTSGYVEFASISYHQGHIAHISFNRLT